MYVRASIAWHARSTPTASTPDAGEELYACDEIPSEITSPCSDHVDQIGLLRMRRRHELWQKRPSALGAPMM